MKINLSNNAVAAAAAAIAQVWTSENKKSDMKQAAILFEPSAIAALTAALPFLAASTEETEPVATVGHRL